MNPGWLLQEIGRAIGSSFRDTFNRQYGPGEGMCPDWLAYGLAAGAVAFTVLAFIAAVVV